MEYWKNVYTRPLAFFLVRKCMHERADFSMFIPLFPLNRSRLFRRYVINHAVDAGDFVDDVVGSRALQLTSPQPRARIAKKSFEED